MGNVGVTACAAVSHRKKMEVPRSVTRWQSLMKVLRTVVKLCSSLKDDDAA